MPRCEKPTWILCALLCSQESDTNHAAKNLDIVSYSSKKNCIHLSFNTQACSLQLKSIASPAAAALKIVNMDWIIN